MISRLILSVIITPIVLSQPDLCRNPKLDSITYISEKFIWFFTSGGYFWYLKESDFPPGAPYGKLPDGFTKGDAAFFNDWLKVCSKGPTARQGINYTITRKDQLVVLVEKVGDGNKIIEFDTRSFKWGNGHTWEDDRVIGRSFVGNPKAEIEAIFSLRDSEVYIVQGEKYAGVDWKDLCTGEKDAFAKPFPSYKTDSALQKAVKDPFDAIAVKENKMYYFIGSNFWISTVDTFKSRNGQIVISKGSKQNISAFFKFQECPKSVPTAPEESGKTTRKVDTEENPNNEEKSPKGSDSAAKESESDSESGVPFLIILILIVLVVVALVIGVVVFLMSGKTPTEDKSAAQPGKSKAAEKPSGKKAAAAPATGPAPAAAPAPAASKATKK